MYTHANAHACVCFNLFIYCFVFESERQNQHMEAQAVLELVPQPSRTLSWKVCATMLALVIVLKISSQRALLQCWPEIAKSQPTWHWPDGVIASNGSSLGGRGSESAVVWAGRLGWGDGPGSPWHSSFPALQCLPPLGTDIRASLVFLSVSDRRVLMTGFQKAVISQRLAGSRVAQVGLKLTGSRGCPWAPDPLTLAPETGEYQPVLPCLVYTALWLKFRVPRLPGKLSTLPAELHSYPAF